MSQSKWDPFRDLMALRERMNQLFETSLTRERELAAGLQAGAWVPAADVFETDVGVVIRAEIPGVKKDDIEVRLEGGQLVLHGERPMEVSRPGSGAVSRLERAYGSFHRAFPLPDWADADPENVEAAYKCGVLELTVPRKSGAAPRRIEVREE